MIIIREGGHIDNCKLTIKGPIKMKINSILENSTIIADGKVEYWLEDPAGEVSEEERPIIRNCIIKGFDIGIKTEILNCNLTKD